MHDIRFLNVCSLSVFRFAPACFNNCVTVNEVVLWGRFSRHPKVPCHSGILQTYSSREYVDAYSDSKLFIHIDGSTAILADV